MLSSSQPSFLGEDCSYEAANEERKRVSLVYISFSVITYLLFQLEGKNKENC